MTANSAGRAGGETAIALEPEPVRSPIRVNFTGLVALFILSVRQFASGKRWWIFSLLFLLPAGLALLIRGSWPDVPIRLLEFVLAYSLIPLGLVPLVTLLNASSIVHDELEDQTITYLLVRPLPKWGIYLAKLLATVTCTAILVAVCTSFTYVALYAFSDAAKGESIIKRCLITDGLMALASVAYCCIFAFISLVTRYLLVAGICYTVILEGIIGRLQFSVKYATVAYYFRVLALRLLDFSFEEGRAKIAPATDAWNIDVLKDPKLLEHPQIAACLYVLIGASAVLALLSAFTFSQKEFRVKTPEGA